MIGVVTFYRFVGLDDPAAIQQHVAQAAQGLKGTVLIAREGINGTLAGARARLDAFATNLRGLPAFAGMEFKFSYAAPDNPVFYRLKVKIKPEIVGFGQPGTDPARHTGKHVDAEHWNALLDDPEVLVVDTRNDYEVAIGTFPGAINPGTRSFREFADFARAHLDARKHARVAMFCTGGIRCEKASAYLLDVGFQEVYQLRGGVLQYLETVQGQDNRWQGECFVFDQRVSVDDALQEGTFEQCFACRRPLSAEDRASPHYERGVSCPYCVEELTDARAAAFKERNRQIALASRAGSVHLGAPARHAQPNPPVRPTQDVERAVRTGRVD